MFKSATDCLTDTDKLQRTGSTESLNNFDIYEENILSSLFQGIPMQHVLALQKSNEQLQNIAKHNNNNNNTNNIISNKDIINNISNLTDSDNISDSDSEINIPKLKCVNVINNTSQTQSLPNISKSILMKTGFREPNEIRIIFKKRPLGIQIKPHNIHGFGAKISKIINKTVETQGVKPNMIITGLNNKDLLGCTFDQIMNILKNANLPITLRLKSIHSLQQKQTQQSNNNLMIPIKHKYIHRKKQKHAQKQHKSLPIETTNLNSDTIVPTTLMLQSFSAENMPISTVLSSSSDEEEPDPEITNEIESKYEMDDIKYEKDYENNDNISYVNWNNIRLGASVIKYGWGLEVNNSNNIGNDNDVTFELAYDALTRQGLNIYEIRAAIRLIRQQPEQIPLLETFDTLTINNQNRIINSSINPKFMPQQWLTETNLNNNNNESESDTESDTESNGINPDIINNISAGKKEIKGYIDFFDDNSTSENEESVSNSISKSIKVEQMFEAIGLKSPPIENMIGLLSPTDSNNNNKYENNGDRIKQMLNMDTPIQDFDVENINFNGFNIIENDDNYMINESNEYSYESDTDSESESSNGNNYKHEEFNENIIGISSYICTEGADMIDNDCIPQVMVKYNGSNNVNDNSEYSTDGIDDIYSLSDNNSNNSSINHKFIKVKNIMKNFKDSMKDNINNINNNNNIGLLTIKTKAKSLLNKISPNTTPSINASKLNVVYDKKNECKDAEND